MSLSCVITLFFISKQIDNFNSKQINNFETPTLKKLYKNIIVYFSFNYDTIKIWKIWMCFTLK